MIQTAELDDSFGNGIWLFCCFNFVLMILLLQAAKTILALNLNMREQKHLSNRSWSKKAVTFSVSGYLWCGGETKTQSPAQTIQAQRLPENAALQTSGETSLVKNFNRWPGPTLLIRKEKNPGITREFRRNRAIFRLRLFSNSFFFPTRYQAESFWFG